MAEISWVAPLTKPPVLEYNRNSAHATSLFEPNASGSRWIPNDFVKMQPCGGSDVGAFSVGERRVGRISPSFCRLGGGQNIYTRNSRRNGPLFAVERHSPLNSTTSLIR